LVPEVEIPPPDIFSIIKKYKLTLKKSLGQNFLIDPSALKGIIGKAEIDPGATVLEIGAGLGSLTYHLAQAAKSVVAVELDRRFIPILNQQFQTNNDVRIIQDDILNLPVAELVASPKYLVVANIPYYITSALIRHLLEQPIKPVRLVLTVQREVAERICAQPGEMSLLALSVQVFGSPRLVMRIPSSAFYPQPNVDSGVVRVDIHSSPLMVGDQVDVFFRLAKAGFSQKRKTMRNALSAGLHWSTQETAEFLVACGIDPMRRAETLNLDEWGVLTERYITLRASNHDR
jgi:16S rRNA (adenine1518-N6/adenine1519-N6)-dimethyltransferase